MERIVTRGNIRSMVKRLSHLEWRICCAARRVSSPLPLFLLGANIVVWFTASRKKSVKKKDEKY